MTTRSSTGSANFSPKLKPKASPRQEADALTAKAADLMAAYGTDRALLAASRPETGTPAGKVITIPSP